MRKIRSQREHIFGRRFTINDFYDVETVGGIRLILGCSLATTYRTLTTAKIPFYFVPHHPGLPILHSATLWRLAATPAFKKYVKRNHLSPNYAKLHIINKVLETRMLPLSVDDGLLAMEAGLIPIKGDAVLPWFITVLQGELTFPFPIK